VRKADPLKLLGSRIREMRQAGGWSQEAVGFEAGLHRNEIGALERGEKNVSFINLLRVCAALEIAPADLLKPFTLALVADLPPKRRSRLRKEK
jgi:transcriptional regulator with XRE-family HTH domain